MKTAFAIASALIIAALAAAWGWYCGEREFYRFEAYKALANPKIEHP